MNLPLDLSQLSPDQLRHLAATLVAKVEEKDRTLAQSQATLRHTEQVNQKLTFELMLLKRHAFGKRSKQRIYPTREAAKSDVFDYIEMFYNPRRRHGTSDDVSPVEYERRYFQSLTGV